MGWFRDASLVNGVLDFMLMFKSQTASFCFATVLEEAKTMFSSAAAIFDLLLSKSEESASGCNTTSF